MTITNTDANNALINPIDLWRASGGAAYSDLGVLINLHPAMDIDEDAVMKKTILRNTHEINVEGWVIGERFDDKLDTEVGGMILTDLPNSEKDGSQITPLMESLDESGTLVTGVTLGLDLEQLKSISLSAIPRAAQIINHATGDRFTLEQAQAIPELSAVANRLAERIAEYDFRKHNKESWQIAKRYKIERDRENFKVFDILYITRESRKFGFPIVNNLLSKSKEEQLTLAVRLLLHSVDINTALPEQFAVLPGTALHNDATDFLSLADANTEQTG